MQMVARILAGAAMIGAVLVLSGCDTATKKLIEQINKRWPPISTTERRARAVTASAAALSTLNPAIYLQLDKSALVRIGDELEKQLTTAKGKPEGKTLPKVSHVKIAAGSGVVGVEADVEAQFDDPAVTVTGRVSGQLTFEPVGNILQPQAAFEAVHLSGLKWRKDKVDAAIAVPAINALLKKTLENINGTIELKPIPLALQPIAPLDPNALKVQGLTVSGNTVPVPVPTVAGVAIYEGGGALEVMADLRLPNEKPADTPAPRAPPPATEAALNNAYDAFSVSFHKMRDQSFGTDTYGGTKAALTRGFAARFLNYTVNNAAVHLVYNMPSQSQPFSVDIRPYSAPQFACDLQQDTRDCHDTQHCSLGHDERSCGHDINPGGWNVVKVHINDPICEAAKAAQNVAYVASFNACNAGNAVAKTACEGQKGAQNAIYAANKAACELNKSALQVVEQLSHIGHISGDVGTSGQASADVHNLGVGASLESVSIDSAVSGAADVLAHVKFDPDTAGRLACTFGWAADLRTRVSIKQQALPIRGTITSDDAGSRLTVHLQGQSIHVQLDPPPIQALFAAHPELVVNCALLVQGVLAPGMVVRALQQKDFPSEISGQYDVALPASEFVVPLQPIPVYTGEVTLQLTPSLHSQAIWFEAG